jgi:hypothetical protein
MRTLILFSCVALAACGKAPVDDSFDDLVGLDQKSDSFSYRMKVVGSLAYGSSQTVKYTSTPRYRAFTFTANADDSVSAWVTSTQGDAVAWLLDSAFNVITSNDDADSTTSNSHLVAHLGQAGTYYIVFRDYYLASHYFTVSLDSGCTAKYAGGGTVDEGVAGYESLMGYTTSYQLVHGSVPACLDLKDSTVRSTVAAQVLASNNVHWATSATPVVQPIATGASGFLSALSASRQQLDNFAASSPVSTAAFKQLYSNVDDFQSVVVSDSQTSPSSYFEFDLHIEAGACSQDGHVRIDTRTGQVLILRALGC